MTDDRTPVYWIVGAGRVGSLMARAAHAHGVLAGITTPHPKPIQNDYADAPEVRVTTEPPASLPDRCVVVLCVQDVHIARVARAWNERALAGMVHTSGACGLEVFEGINGTTHFAALHPLLSIPNREMTLQDAHRTIFGLTAVDNGDRIGREMASWFCGEVIEVAQSDRSAWHLAATLASNGVYAIVQHALAVATQAGFLNPQLERGLAHLAAQSAQNIVNDGVIHATTGPVVRGDAATVQKHMTTMRTMPDVRSAYIALSRALLTIAESRELRDLQLVAIRAILESQSGE